MRVPFPSDPEYGEWLKHNRPQDYKDIFKPIKEVIFRKEKNGLFEITSCDNQMCKSYNPCPKCFKIAEKYGLLQLIINYANDEIKYWKLRAETLDRLLKTYEEISEFNKNS